MIRYSIPVFKTFDEISKIEQSKTNTTAICQCPLPLMTDNGGYCHVVEYEKTYTCKNCNTVFFVGRYMRY